jgi:hypothetical protein
MNACHNRDSEMSLETHNVFRAGKTGVSCLKKTPVLELIAMRKLLQVTSRLKYSRIEDTAS